MINHWEKSQIIIIKSRITYRGAGGKINKWGPFILLNKGLSNKMALKDFCFLFWDPWTTDGAGLRIPKTVKSHVRQNDKLRITLLLKVYTQYWMGGGDKSRVVKQLKVKYGKMINAV